MLGRTPPLTHGGSSAAFIACALFFVFAHTASAATLYVNSSTGNDTTGDGSSGAPYATFHKAYTAAATSGDTINLTGTFTWTNAGEAGDAQYSGYSVSKSLTITGQSATSTIIQADTASTTGDRRVFTIKNGYTVTIQDVTVRNGRNATSYSGTDGGGIYVEAGATLAVEDCRITDNYVSSTSWGGYGGGINNAGTLTVNRCTIDNNFAYSQGGGINNAYLASGANTVTITNSTIAFNSTAATVATVGGAGLYLRSGTGTVTNTTIAYNNAPDGTGDTTGIDIVSGATLRIKNSIVSDNKVGGADVSASSGNWFDVTNSGTLTDNGGNIFGKVNTAYSGVSFHATSWYDLYSNGAGDEVYRLSSNAAQTGSLYLATSLADNSTTNATQTFAISNAGSIAIDNGQSGTNGAVSVPGIDQRGLYRSSSADIGAYEYNGSATDSTAPTVSLTAPSSGATVSGASVSLAASASDNASVAGVLFYVDGVVQGSEDTTSTYGITWNSTATSTGSHAAFAVARDTSNNYATSTSVAFTVDNTAPGISSIATTTATTTATITWTTDEAASSLINFGLTSSYGTSTAETNTSSRVTSHSVTLVGLAACTQYYYQVRSADAAGNVATSSAATLLSAGCTGSASISATAIGSIATSTGGTLTRGVLTLTVPTAFTTATSSAFFQAHQLEGSTFFSSAGGPSGKTRAGDTVFTLRALTDATTTISSFAAPLTVTLSYAAGDVSGLDESTLAIYRYDGSSWHALSNCSTNTGARTVSCETTSFSDFAIFGSTASSGGGSSSSSGGGIPSVLPPMSPQWGPGYYVTYSAPAATSSEPIATIMGTLPIVISAPASPVATTTSATTQKSASFTRTLRTRVSHGEVKALQQFLNTTGFLVAPEGAGFPGNETEYFGTRTQLALKKFQEAHAQEILIPLGLSRGTGIFGSSTRAFMNAWLSR